MKTTYEISLKEINEWVKKGEHQTLEFKKKIAHPEKVVREVVAFANTQGGKIIIGVDDDRTVSGLRYAEEEQYALEEAIKRYCHPPISFTSHLISISAKKGVVVFLIEESIQKPHVVIEKPEALPGKAYVRVKDKSIQASKEMREILKHSKKNKELRFQFGEKEAKLMQYLALHGSITKSIFCRIAEIPSAVASRTLVLLVLTNVLSIHPDDKEDWYTSKEE